MDEQGREICWNLINSLLGGLIFLAGSFTANMQLEPREIFFAAMVALGIVLTQFKEYWTTQKNEYGHKINKKGKLFKFV